MPRPEIIRDNKERVIAVVHQQDNAAIGIRLSKKDFEQICVSANYNFKIKDHGEQGSFQLVHQVSLISNEDNSHSIELCVHYQCVEESEDVFVMGILPKDVDALYELIKAGSNFE